MTHMRGEERMNRVNANKRPEKAWHTLWRLMGYFRHCRGMFVAALISVAVYSCATVYASYLMKPFVNLLGVSGITQNQAYAGCIALLLGMAALYALSALTNYLLNLLMMKCSAVMLEALRRDMFVKMQDLPIAYFDAHPHGELMSYYTNDTDAARDLVRHGITQLLISTISLVGIIGMMLALSGRLFLIMLLMAVVVTALVRLVTSRTRKNYKGRQKAVADVNAYVEEMISGQKDVKVFNHERQVMEGFAPINEELRKRSATAATLGSIMGPMMNNLSHIFYAITTVVGVLWLSGEGVGGVLIAFLQYIRQFANRVSQISDQFNFIMLALAGAERVFAVIDAQPETDEGKTVLINTDSQGRECTQRSGSWGWKKPDGSIVPLKGEVRFENVSFSYDGQRQVLKNVSLYAKPGQKIAFVGSTGAGKTTVTNLINRFYDVQQGTITYDGIDVKEIRKADLRRSLGMVLQDTHLFSGSVMENIRYGRLDASEEECIEAAKIANAHYFISHLSQGYDTQLISGGTNLSQGQRQLLAIARAAVSDPPVLILDEATSSVDTRTEMLIERGMDALMKGRTVFVIAHRLSTVRNADAILVLEDGRIIERGDHQSLLEQKGRYYQLYTGMFELS